MGAVRPCSELATVQLGSWLSPGLHACQAGPHQLICGQAVLSTFYVRVSELVLLLLQPL